MNHKMAKKPTYDDMAVEIDLVYIYIYIDTYIYIFSLSNILMRRLKERERLTRSRIDSMNACETRQIRYKE